jgi:hypothetical protein
MKPFDLEAARKGLPVQTRGGSPARIVCFNAEGPNPLVVLLKDDDKDSSMFGHEDVWLYSAGGKFNEGSAFSTGNLDLVMA